MAASNESLDEFTTDRLIARRPRLDDLADYCRLYSDPRVTATLGGLRTFDHTRESLNDQIAHYERHGYGLWIWRDRSEGRFVGRGGLWNVHVGGNDEVEVGYALMPEYWGRGLATEIARASVRVAFQQAGLTELVSFTLPTNRASSRVMEKTGFTYERDIVYKDLPHVLYRLSR